MQIIQGSSKNLFRPSKKATLIAATPLQATQVAPERRRTVRQVLAPSYLFKSRPRIAFNLILLLFTFVKTFRFQTTPLVI